MITEFQSETNHYICTNISKIAQVECNQDHFLSFDDAKVDKPRNYAKLRA